MSFAAKYLMEKVTIDQNSAPIARLIENMKYMSTMFPFTKCWRT
jgi:hypothetical protein